jgi:hypothetical protein
LLTPFQERIAAIISGLAEAEGFALAGGGALIVRGDVDRGTRDLDFFGLTPESVNGLAPAVELALTAAKIEVTTLQSNQGFVRLMASQGNERCEIDLAADARLFPIDTRPTVPTLTGEELAVDKVLAIFGRAEASSLPWSPNTASSDSVNWLPRKTEGSRLMCSEKCSTDLTACNAESLRSMMKASIGSVRPCNPGESAREISPGARCSARIEEMTWDWGSEGDFSGSNSGVAVVPGGPYACLFELR